MKLNFNDITVERSTAFQSQHFDIGNKRIILEILRGKMYSNPIQTICQEISCNARDAHREVGKDSVPIEIKLPNKLEPWFWIKDFGPGITPERMADVFIKYGCSTKRDDNTQTGGWGLGAKSGFSYSDTFTVISVTPENSKMIRREYIAHIDESGLGQMSCVKEEETTEPQGTTVVITPKEKDYNLFAEQTLRATMFWKVKPIIRGATNWQWPKVSIDYQGNGWEVHGSQTSFSAFSNTPHVLLDGIPYPIKCEHLFKNKQPVFPNYRSVPLRLHFNVGEILITANREELDYQDRTIKTLESHIDAAFTELRSAMTKSVLDAPSLNKAIVAWLAARNHRQFGHLISPMHWQPKGAKTSIAIAGPDLPLTATGSDATKTVIYCNLYYRANNEYGFNRDVLRAKHITIDSQTLIAEDDIASSVVSRQRLANLFEAFPDIKRVYLISFYRKPTTEEVVKEDGTKYNREKIIVEEESYTVNKKIAELTCHWNYLEKVKLSDYEKKAIATKKPNPVKSALQLRYIEGGSTYVKSDAFDTLAAATGTKYYLSSSGNNFSFFVKTQKGETEHSLTKRDLDDSLYALRDLQPPGVKLHLINSRHLPLLNSDWKPFRDLVESLVKIEAANYGGKLYQTRNGSPTDHFADPLVKGIKGSLHQIKDQNSLFVKFFSQQTNNSRKNNYAFQLAKTFKIDVPLEHSDPCEIMVNQLKKEFPLISHINLYYHDNSTSAVIADLISYVNMKLEQKKVPGSK
ncbi:hypothetical protein C4588_08040 [Candidatus Parcubacteria bacterium]|nr:MAG: hypothetical protein C4588_08040 [Candidatus Parcubacteria bacterium]